MVGETTLRRVHAQARCTTKALGGGQVPRILLSSLGTKPGYVNWWDLPDILGQLETWIDDTGKIISEEAQMAIGAVQVEDARTMKRQTEWTVALGVLAAIYLPMALVTGIFGMNITEISAIETAPTRWSVVKAWGIIFGAKLGSILLYTALRLLRLCWRILRLCLKRLYFDERATSPHVGLKTPLGWIYGNPREFKRLMEKWLLIDKVRAVIRKVKELDLEAQKMD